MLARKGVTTFNPLNDNKNNNNNNFTIANTSKKAIKNNNKTICGQIKVVLVARREEKLAEVRDKITR